MSGGPGLVPLRFVGFVLYVLVILACVFGAAATDNAALKVVAVVVLVSAVVARMTIKVRGGIKQRRVSGVDKARDDFLELAVVKYYPWTTVGVVGLMVVGAALTDSVVLRVVLLVLIGLVAVSAPFAMREIRRLSAQQRGR